jgi:hypothetical protein
MVAPERLGEHLVLVLLHHVAGALGSEHVGAEVMRLKDCGEFAGSGNVLDG